MIAEWTTLETTVNQIRLRLACRVPCRVEHEDAECRVDAHDHHEVVGLVGRPGIPCPPRRPDQGQGIEKEHNRAKDRECELKKFVSGGIVPSKVSPVARSKNTSALVEMVVNAAQQDPCSSLGCYTTWVAKVSDVAAYSADGCLIRVSFRDS